MGRKVTSWLLGLLRGLWGYIVIALMSAGLVLAYMARSNKTAVLKERIKQRKKVDETVEKAKRGTDRLDSDPARRDELRRKRTRD